MTCFDQPQNFKQNLESLLRRVRPRVITPQHTLSASEPIISAPYDSNSMAQKTLRDFSAPSTSNVPVGPDVSTGRVNFEIKTGLVTMVQASPFCGKANEDASAHLQQFLDLCSTYVTREFRKMLSGFECFRFLFWGERSSGSMLTGVQ